MSKLNDRLNGNLKQLQKHFLKGQSPKSISVVNFYSHDNSNASFRFFFTDSLFLWENNVTELSSTDYLECVKAMGRINQINKLSCNFVCRRMR